MAQKIKIGKTALIVIDIVNSCCHKRCEIKRYGITFNKIRQMVPRLRRFIEEYRVAGGEVVFIRCAPWRKEYLAKNLVELYKDPRCRYYTKDRTGFSEEFYEMRPGPRDHVFTKNTYDAFTNPRLANFLKQKKKSHLLITGIFGDGCVNATINGGFSAGYNLVMIKDLIETTDSKGRQRHQNRLKEQMWPTMYGKTIVSRQLLGMLILSAQHRKL
ncbi:cysteine hydrolase [Candidatus Woesearchaeota archaeon]|nr:cysteine hydrolase [Candidatus Woesearchaeota archaeon]